MIVPESVDEFTNVPRSVSLNGLNPDLLKTLDNDNSKISIILDKHETIFSGAKPSKCGVKSRIRAFYSAIIEPNDWMKRHIFPYLCRHWEIETSMAKIDSLTNEKNAKRTEKSSEIQDCHYTKRLALIKNMEQKIVPMEFTGKRVQVILNSWFDASYYDQRKIVSEIVEFWKKDHLESDGLALGAKGLDYHSLDMKKLTKNLPHVSEDKILQVLTDQEGIFIKEKKQWYIHCGKEMIGGKRRSFIPKSKNQYLLELELKENPNISKFRLDFDRRKDNFEPFQHSWDMHCQFYNCFKSITNSVEKGYPNYNRFIVYQMNLFWRYFSEGLSDLHGTRKLIKRRTYSGIGGYERGWGHLVIAYAIFKLTSAEKKQFFELEPKYPRFHSQFHNGGAEKRWKKFLENPVPRQKIIPMTSNEYCEELVVAPISECYFDDGKGYKFESMSESLEDELRRNATKICNTLLIRFELKPKTDDDPSVQWECMVCGNIDNYDRGSKIAESEINPLQKASRNTNPSNPQRGRAPRNKQDAFDLLRARNFPVKISKWREKLTREQQKFFDRTDYPLKLCQKYIEGRKDRIDNHFFHSSR
jgi:hypothetical protein